MSVPHQMRVPCAPASRDALTVGDLFCGAGGFSEGFRQAGFKVKWAVDSWPTAITTFRKNHPDVGDAAVLDDILDLDPSDFEPVDVLIGSPPCVHFSLANRGGNGDRAVGLRLVKKFLTFVRDLEPKYWVMENVPNLLPILEEELQWDGTFPVNDGKVPIPIRRVLDVADYGIPQHRRRMFSGDFPLPAPTHGRGRLTHVPLSAVLSSLPDPRTDPSSLKTPIRDPNYPALSMLARDLRDHFEDKRWWLTEYERQRSRRQKERHPVYGKMSYPDSIDRPSRTITATRTGGARSTIVIHQGPRSVRTLTAREAATIQGYPLTYQFWANSMSDKDVLIGNAVPPPMARAIANSILAAEGIPALASPKLNIELELPQPLKVSIRRIHHFSPRRHYNGVVRINDSRHDHRVELDNKYPPVKIGTNGRLSVEWKTRLYLGYAKDYVCYEIPWSAARELVARLLVDRTLGLSACDFASFFQPLTALALNGFPTAQALQDRWCGRVKAGIWPDQICDWVASAVECALPSQVWAKHPVPLGVTAPILQPLRIKWGKEASNEQPLPVSVRLLAAAVGLSLLCERLNHGAKEVERLGAAIQAGEHRVTSYFDTALYSPRNSSLVQIRSYPGRSLGTDMA